MTFKEFREKFKGCIACVSDGCQSYTSDQESEIADREVEKFTNDEDGVHVVLVKETSIPVDDFLSITDNIFLRVYGEKLKTVTKISKEDAMRVFSNYKITKYTIYKGCLLIKVKKR